MTNSSANAGRSDHRAEKPLANGAGSPDGPVSDEAAQHALAHGDNEKIDRVLNELDVSTTTTGKDQSGKADTEGSNSSSKNLDEQNE
jgi:hypothetical protein